MVQSRFCHSFLLVSMILKITTTVFTMKNINPEIDTNTKFQDKSCESPGTSAANAAEDTSITLRHPITIPMTVMAPMIVRRISLIRDEKLRPDNEYHGRYFTATDDLYNQARAEMKQENEYTGPHKRYENLAPYLIEYPQKDKREVNAVFCRGKPRNFILRKVDNYNYMIYHETIDA